MDYQAYEPEVLKKLQRVETKILADFNTLCEENDIDYFTIAGTLLGSIRHKGFIPWDDDIDVGMTRENYDKFLAVADNAMGGKYRLLNYETDPKFALIFSKWCKEGTVFRDGAAIEMGYTAGIPIDVFCFDDVPDDRKKRRRQGWRAWAWGKLFVLRNIGKPPIYAYGFKVKIIAAIARIGNWLLRLFHVSSNFLYKKATWEAEKYNGTKTNYVSHMFDPIPHLSVLKREDIYPTYWADFEDIKIKLPRRPEKYLKPMYGSDYMAIPPEERRHNHPPIELDFGSEE